MNSKSFSLLLTIGLLILLIGCKTTEEINIEEPPIEVVTVELPTEEPAEVIEIIKVDPEAPYEVVTAKRPAEYEEDSEAPYASSSLKESSASPRMAESKMMSSDAAGAVAMSRSKAAPSPGVLVIGKTKDEVQHVEAGQLTAGEWNDLHNWDDWKELLTNTDYKEMEEHWDLHPNNRYSIFVRNKYELPIQDARVEMLDASGKVVWSARTDNSGHAELWAGLNKQSSKKSGSYKAKVTAGGKTKTIDNLKAIESGVNNVDVDIACTSPKNVDIFFAVDATGSMGDEIRYLQEELKDVISNTLAANNGLNIRLGSVFYRDSSDQYLTRTQPLSADAQKTVDFIAAQSAQGGGDYPEAVDAALEDALAQDWSEDAIARIVFLLLDAPPHKNPETLQRLKEQIEDAAAEGIKIIPITASGINRQTEFLMKFMAIGTNATYVFITDHSGIGGAHLDPVVQDFEVEKLNDLLVRLLYNYTKSNGCDANETTVGMDIKMFPNPATNFITVKTPTALEEVRLLSNSGMLIWSKSDVEAGELRIELGDLIDGVYTIQCRSADDEYARPIIVVNS